MSLLSLLYVLAGNLAIHPDQLGVINIVFILLAEELDHARRTIVTFAATAGAGTVMLDDGMIDLVRLRSAHRQLGSAGT